MSMPEAPIDEDSLPPRREHNVRGAGKILAVEAESVAERVQKATNA